MHVDRTPRRRSSNNAKVCFMGPLFTKVKAHENAVKQYIDFGVILLQQQNNNRSLWSAMNRASPGQINIRQRNDKQSCEIIFPCVYLKSVLEVFYSGKM